MRFLLTFIAGGIFSLAIAIAWMPRTAWIEFLDHVEDPHHVWPMRHGLNHNIQAPGLSPGPFGYRPNPDEGLPITDLYFYPAEPAFQLTQERVKHICLFEEEKGTLFKRGERQYFITLTPDAVQEFAAVMKKVYEKNNYYNGLIIRDIQGVDLGGVYADERSLNWFLNENPAPAHFYYSATEPYLEAAEDSLFRLFKLRQVKECVFKDDTGQ